MPKQFFGYFHTNKKAAAGVKVFLKLTFQGTWFLECMQQLCFQMSGIRFSWCVSNSVIVRSNGSGGSLIKSDRTIVTLTRKELKLETIIHYWTTLVWKIICKQSLIFFMCSAEWSPYVLQMYFGNINLKGTLWTLRTFLLKYHIILTNWQTIKSYPLSLT